MPEELEVGLGLEPVSAEPAWVVAPRSVAGGGWFVYFAHNHQDEREQDCDAEDSAHTPMATFLASLMAWPSCAFFHSFFLGFAQAGTAIPVRPLSPNATSGYRNWIW